MTKITEMMRQYLALKEKHKDCILMYRLGDFYEMFFDDAITASKELEITLTGRNCGLEQRAPMCGVPHHSAEGYISKLIQKGYKVALCEQLSDPATTKGIVERDVVRIITPGTVIEPSMLDEKKNNYILSIYMGDTLGLAFCDVSTGEFFAGETEAFPQALYDELSRIAPSEIIADEGMFFATEKYSKLFSGGHMINCYDTWAYDFDNSQRALLGHFSVSSLSVLDLQGQNNAVRAAGALISYIEHTQKNALGHINSLSRFSRENYMVLETATRRNLELTQSLRGDKKGTLLHLLDKTVTSMGGRKLRSYIEQPLQSIDAINKRFTAIDELIGNRPKLDDIRDALKSVYDISRLCSKISYASINARDCLSLKASLEKLPHIKNILSGFSSEILLDIASVDAMQDICKLLASAIAQEPPISVAEGSIIQSGYNAKVDELREAASKGLEWMAKLEAAEREETGIKNLKIGYNKVFGYYIDITKSNLSQVPYRYIRKQTLANSERFITPELKEMEEKVLGAQDKCNQLEHELFIEIRGILNDNIKRLQQTADKIASLDAIASLALVAMQNNYCRPSMNTQGCIEILEGRHPVVESSIDMFVSNNTLLNVTTDRFLIITGPNMAGKSTYMRQIALITLMAHIGSFVPAKYANISLVDRIFTRVGASDDLFAGQSTFMVEMSEMAAILKHATPNSLIIIDEIGRGTSTFDGLSIAWAVVEYICSTETLRAKTLFATHYHELSELEGHLEGVKNYRVSVKEIGDDIVFLRKIVRGSADKSFGIQVAKLAGLPDWIVQRAKEILNRLESSDINRDMLTSNHTSQQISLFAAGGDAAAEDVMGELISLDVDSLTPMQAMNILNDLKTKAKGN